MGMILRKVCEELTRVRLNDMYKILQDQLS